MQLLIPFIYISNGDKQVHVFGASLAVLTQ